MDKKNDERNQGGACNRPLSAGMPSRRVLAAMAGLAIYSTQNPHQLDHARTSNRPKTLLLRAGWERKFGVRLGCGRRPQEGRTCRVARVPSSWALRRQR